MYLVKTGRGTLKGSTAVIHHDSRLLLEASSAALGIKQSTGLQLLYGAFNRVLDAVWNGGGCSVCVPVLYL